MIMAERSTLGIMGLIILSALMFVFSYLFYGYGEGNVSLILLFAGLVLAGVLAVAVLMPKNSDNS